MTKIKIVTETILKIKKSDEKEMRVKAYSWQKKVADFLDLVQKTLFPLKNASRNNSAIFLPVALAASCAIVYCSSVNLT